MAYRPDIDGLRAVAVLSVVVFHAFPGRLPGGFLGVDVFFVISGYLISTIILSDLSRGHFTVAEFYQRRITRIFPALFVVLLAAFAFGWFALLADEYQQLGKHIAGGAGFVSNLVSLNERGYFDNSSETKPLLHLWSLGIEEQFYIVWPLLLAFVWHRRWPLFSLIAILGLASFATDLGVSGSDPTAAFYWPFTRLWELMVGGGLAWVALHRGALIRPQKDLQSLVGVAFLVAAGAALDRDRLLPTVGAVLIISAGPSAWINRVILSNPALVQVGLISYPLYLWHWPLLSFARIVESQKPSIAVRGVMVIASFVLAWLTYRLIERPIRFGQRRLAATGALCVVMLAIGTLGLVTYAQDGFPARMAINQYTWNAKVTQQFAGTKWQYTTNPTCMNRYPLDEARSYDWWFCTLSKDESPTVAILGTSYANQLYPGLVSQTALSQQTFLSIGTCHPIAVNPLDATDDETDDPCSGRHALQQQRFIDDVIARSPTIKHIILDGLYEDPDADYIAALKSRIDTFEKSGARVIVFEPHLRVDLDIRGCFSRPFRQATLNCEVPVAERVRRRATFRPLIDSISTTNPKVLFFDPNDLFCDATTCRLVRNGLPLYRDEFQHISEYGSGVLGNLFVAWARTNAPDLLTRTDR